MAFEMFTKLRGAKNNDECKVSFKKSGYIGFNKQATERYIGKNRFVACYYDKTNSRIGFKFHPNKSSIRFSMIPAKMGGYFFYPYSFLKHYGIKVDKIVKPKMQVNKVLAVELNGGN